MPTRRKKTLQQQGFTALEMLISVAIIGILTAVAIPSFEDMLERRRLVAAAEMIASDLRWARSEALKRNEDVTVTFTSGADWAYEINTDLFPVILPIVCPAPDTNILKAVCSSTINEFQGVTLRQNFSGGNTTFNHLRGTVSSLGKACLIAPAGELRVILSFLGRARICSVNGLIGNYDTCTNADTACP